MNICKNCRNEVNGKYCSSCSQVYIEKQTAKTLFRGFIEALDINNKFLSTIKGIFIFPGRLVRNYSEGNTNKYLGPFTMLMIVIGLKYFLSESNILGFSLINSNNELFVFLDRSIELLLVSLIAGILPFTAFNWVKFIILSFYAYSGFFLIQLLVEIASGFEWIYETSGLHSHILNYLIGVYSLYFIFSVFKGHYRSLVIYLALYATIALSCSYIKHDVIGQYLGEPNWELDALDKLRFIENEIPHWSSAKLTYDTERKFYPENILTDTSYFDIDVNKDGIRDITVFVRDSLKNDFIVTIDITKDQAQIISLKGLFDLRSNGEIVAINTSSDTMEQFVVSYSDSSEYLVYWRENQIYGKRSN